MENDEQLDALEALDDPLAEHDAGDEDEIAAIPVRDQPPFQIERGKYKGLILPRMIGVKPSLYDRVTALRDEIIDDPNFQRHAGSIAQTYAALRREADEKAAELSEIKLRLAACMLLMVDQFEVESASSITLKSGDRINAYPEPHLIVMNKEDFRQWCIIQGFERNMTLPWGTANKIVKEMLVHGQTEPPGCESFARWKVRFTRGGK